MTEKARLTKKDDPPTEESIRLFMGDEAWKRLLRFEAMLQDRYDLNREMKFPFGRSDGWGFRYAHKKSLLLYVFFEKGGFCCTISINDKGAPKVENMKNDLLPVIQTLWTNRYPCGKNGGWIHHSVESDDVLPDLIRLISVKVRPKKVI